MKNTLGNEKASGQSATRVRCTDARRFIDEFIDDELDPVTRDSFRSHVEGCDVCTRYLEQYSSTIDLCKCDGKVDPPSELVETTLEFLRTRGLAGAED